MLVAGHHPPFTNALWHKPSLAVLDNFVAPFKQSRKARASFAGHVHGYERFAIDGKCLVVSGGGGGARFSHRHGEKRRRPAVVDLEDPHPFHYVSVQVTADAVAFSVRVID